MEIQGVEGHLYPRWKIFSFFFFYCLIIRSRLRIINLKIINVTFYFQNHQTKRNYLLIKIRNPGRGNDLLSQLAGVHGMQFINCCFEFFPWGREGGQINLLQRSLSQEVPEKKKHSAQELIFARAAVQIFQL